jgi:hypothetical protein
MASQQPQLHGVAPPAPYLGGRQMPFAFSHDDLDTPVTFESDYYASDCVPSSSDSDEPVPPAAPDRSWSGTLLSYLHVVFYTEFGLVDLLSDLLTPYCLRAAIFR